MAVPEEKVCLAVRPLWWSLLSLGHFLPGHLLRPPPIHDLDALLSDDANVHPFSGGKSS